MVVFIGVLQKLSFWSLFKSIESHVEFAHMIKFLLINKTYWLLHVNLFF